MNNSWCKSKNNYKNSIKAIFVLTFQLVLLLLFVGRRGVYVVCCLSDFAKGCGRKGWG